MIKSLVFCGTFYEYHGSLQIRQLYLDNRITDTREVYEQEKGTVALIR
jgi:hypothetical protein